MPIVYCLIKMYDRKEYADDLLKGKLYFNTIEHHRKTGRDPLEGIVQREVKGDFTILIGHHELKLEDAVSKFQAEVDNIKYTPVYCMTAIHSGDFEKVNDENIEDFRKQVMLSPKCATEYGNHAVVIHQPDEFMQRVRKNASNYNFGHGWIQYFNPQDQIDASMLNQNILFYKRDKFKHENEIRLAIQRGTEDEGHFELDVGDLSDIAFYYKTNEFNRNLNLALNSGAVDSGKVQVTEPRTK